jgi:predicted secreted protein
MDPLESRLLLSGNPAAVASDALVSPSASVAEFATAPGPVTGVGVTIHARAGQRFAGDVGKLVWATLAAAGSRSFVGSIDWGDGQAATTATSKLDSAGVVGSGGTFVATFKAAKVGSAVVTMAYERPWETGQPAQTFSVTISVNSRAIAVAVGHCHNPWARAIVLRTAVSR